MFDPDLSVTQPRVLRCEFRFNLLVLKTNDGLSVTTDDGQLIYKHGCFKNIIEDTDDYLLLIFQNGFSGFYLLFFA